MLEREDDRFIVETAKSASEGMDRLVADDFDCIVSDHDMAGENGIEFLETVRENHPDLPFILFTGMGSESVASDAIAKGATDYLRKQAGREQYELLANRITNAVEEYRAKKRAANLDRIRRTIRNVNQALVRAGRPDEIEQRVCGIISDSEPYRFAWIGEVDSDAQTVEPRTAAGVDEGYLDTIEITTEEGATGEGPTGRAVRTRELVAEQNIPESAEYEPWREDALERGYRSSAAVPIIHEDTMYGVLNVYAKRTHAFDQKERELLRELADDIAHARDRLEVLTRQRRLERIMETLPVGVYRATPGPEGEVVDANPALADIFDADSADTLVGQRVSDFYHQTEERQAFSEQLQREGLVRGKELRQETIEGDEIFIEVTATRIEEDDTVEFGGIIQDITEQKKTEQQLKLFRAGVESAGHSIYFTDADGTIEYVNPAFEEITGYEADEAIGRNPRILKSGEHSPEFYEELWETILAGDIWRDEIVNTTRSGDRYVVDQTIAPVEGDAGEIDHFVAVNVDVTERKEYERELERHEAYLNQSHDIITVVDAEGTVRFQSESTDEITGFTPSEVVGEPGFEYVHPDDREKVMTLFTSVVDEPEEVVSAEMRVETKDDSWRWIEVRGVNELADPVIEGLIVTSWDITERKEYERQLQRENERLDEFAEVISHDLRNPLNVAQGRATLLQQEVESEHIDALVEALDRMEAIIEDTLTLARQGKLVGDKETTECSALIEKCWQMVETGEATLEIADEFTIMGDPDRLQALCENLFRNAVEHGGEDVTVRVGKIDEEGLYVEDDGPGIPEEGRSQIFEAGYSTSEQGTGLGLTIVKQVVEAHDWEISVTESESGGARFEITDVEFASN
jgi:PAS domain S-box-containing protein